MKLKTELYRDLESRKEEVGDDKDKWIYIFFGVFMLYSIGILSDVLPLNSITYFIGTVLIIVWFWFKFADLSSGIKTVPLPSPIGVVEISETNMTWNGEIIAWGNIEKVKCELYSYGNSEFGDSRTLENKIYILTKNKKEFRGSIFLKTKAGVEELKELMWEVVKSNDFSYDNAKGLINPGDYKGHQEIKDYLKQKKKLRDEKDTSD